MGVKPHFSYQRLVFDGARWHLRSFFFYNRSGFFSSDWFYLHIIGTMKLTCCCLSSDKERAATSTGSFIITRQLRIVIGKSLTSIVLLATTPQRPADLSLFHFFFISYGIVLRQNVTLRTCVDFFSRTIRGECLWLSPFAAVSHHSRACSSCPANNICVVPSLCLFSFSSSRSTISECVQIWPRKSW